LALGHWRTAMMLKTSAEGGRGAARDLAPLPTDSPLHMRSPHLPRP
jgi:hypothetical protein